ncbi:MAG: redoxin domain-containing protein [Saprospiraceae bacterium]|nr:redoxin domain-containing protein [Saprospiraceae bacterium]
MKSLIVALIFVFPLFANIHAKPIDSTFYDIQLTLKGIKNDKLYLGFYLGEQTFIVDSTVVDLKTSSLRFKPNRPLAEGLYFIAHTEGILFDLILANEADFSIVTDIQSPYDSAQITHSKENQTYFAYKKKSDASQNEVRQIQAMTDMLRRAKADKSVLAEQQQKIRERYEALEVFTRQLIQQNPSLLASRFLNLITSPPVPADVSPVLDNRKPNPAYWYSFRKHFFDCVDFTDKRLLRSPFYTKRIEQFLGYMSTNPDSVKSELDFILEKTRPNPDYYRYTLNWLTAVFDNNLEKMYNADAYLIHLVEKYHRNLDSGTDKYVMERLEYKVNAFKNVLIGNAAPAIELPDTEGVKQSLYDIKTDNTLIIFYSSLCSHCRTTLPQLQSILQYIDSSKLTIFTVCTDGQKEPWLAFINEMKMQNWKNVLDTKQDSDIQKKYATWNLPVMYLLDKNKNIVANRIRVDNLPDLIKSLYEKQ